MADITTKTQTQGKRGPKMAKFVPPSETQGALTKPNNYCPSEKMVNFTQALFSEEVKGNITLAAEKAGVRRESVYQLYNSNPLFREWFLAQRSIFLGLHGAKFDIALVSLDPKVVPSVRTFYEGEGRIGPKAQKESPMRKGFKVTIEGEEPLEEPRETKEVQAEVVSDSKD